MKLNINPAIFEQQPDLKIGAIVIKGMNNTKRVSAVESLLRGISAQRAKYLKDQDIFEHPMVTVWNNAYGKFGINPKKYLPSIAALLKRIKSGKEIPHINVLVDLYNYFSLKYLLPIGGEDLDWLCGDLNLDFTKGGEPFRPINSIDVEITKEGEIAYIDNGGITCRYWNHKECERTKFTAKTVNAVLLIEDLSKMHMDQFGSVLHDIKENIIKYIGGNIEIFILNEDNRMIDLGIEGRRNADDSKIPMQEKAHFQAQQAQKENLKHKAEAKRKPESKLKPEAKLELETELKPEAKLKPEADSKKKPRVLCSKASLRGSDEEKLNLRSRSFAKEKIRKIINGVIKKIFPELKGIDAKIEYPASSEHGDYASNIALQLTKELKIAPREIAEKIVGKIKGDNLIDKIEIAGPGFINIFFPEKILEKEVKNILKEKEKYGQTNIGKDKTIIVEYSQPNIAKPLGVHHLLSTIIGQSLYNIFSELGFKTISINHIGDWGTQFGKLICAYKKWGDKKIVEENPIPELQKLYVKFHEEAEKNITLEDEARKEFKIFEEGDRENRKLWEWFVAESMKDVQKTYDKLGGIHFDFIQGESFYEDKMAQILADGKKKKIIVEGEEGAYVIHFNNPNLPTVPVQKKDGTTLYITRDLAQIKYRIGTWKPLKILYVVDVAQMLHFKQYFEASRMLGFHKNEGVHVWFGRMNFKDEKMSTRKGNIILLDEVLNEAVKRAKEIVKEKNPNLKNKEKVAEVIGIGAIKYNILSQNRTTDIVFDWDKILSLEGNSAPYLQYTYARARSILRNIKTVAGGQQYKEESDKNKNFTRDLISLFPKYSERAALAAEEYKPNILCNYLYDLAQKFNSFYNNVPVLRAEKKEDRNYRLKIVESAAQILKNGLKLLGVEVVEEM